MTTSVRTPLVSRRVPPIAPLVKDSLRDSLVAGGLSTAALLWRGRRDDRSAAAPLNAISHWFWPRTALRRDGVSLRHTGTGVLVHFASSLLWGAVYAALRRGRRQPTALNAALDAAAVTAMAATVDLKLVPERLTPGFEHRLSPRSLVLVYATFALGLAWAGARR